MVDLSLSEKDYRALELESFSSLKYLASDVGKYFYYKTKPFTGNAATDLGTAIHHYFQGNKHLVKFSTLSKRHKEYKEFSDAFMTETNNEGIILSASYQEKIETIEKNYTSNPKIVEMLKQFEFEKGYCDELSMNGNSLKIKGRVDGVSDKALLEIKSFGYGVDANVEDLREMAYDRDYDLQAAIYQLLSGDSRKHYFLFAQTQPPYSVVCYVASKKFISSGKDKLKTVLENYKKYVIDKEPYEQDFEEL